MRTAMRTVNVKVGQVWAFPTFESWYQKHSLNSGTELKYEGYRVISIQPHRTGYPALEPIVSAFNIVDVELQHVKARTTHRVLSGPQWTESEQQKLIEDVP